MSDNGDRLLAALTTRQLLAEVADRGEALGNADLEYNAQLLIEALPPEVLDAAGTAEPPPGGRTRS